MFSGTFGLGLFFGKHGEALSIGLFLSRAAVVSLAGSKTGCNWTVYALFIPFLFLSPLSPRLLLDFFQCRDNRWDKNSDACLRMQGAMTYGNGCWVLSTLCTTKHVSTGKTWASSDNSKRTCKKLGSSPPSTCTRLACSRAWSRRGHSAFQCPWHRKSCSVCALCAPEARPCCFVGHLFWTLCWHHVHLFTAFRGPKASVATAFANALPCLLIAQKSRL